YCPNVASCTFFLFYRLKLPL
ncbi:hypothetical protein EAG_10558, partial [Camponotus floridanus]